MAVLSRARCKYIYTNGAGRLELGLLRKLFRAHRIGQHMHMHLEDKVATLAACRATTLREAVAPTHYKSRECHAQSRPASL